MQIYLQISKLQPNLNPPQGIKGKYIISPLQTISGFFIRQSTQANKFTAQGNKSVAPWNKFAAQGNFWSKPELPTEEEKVFFRGDCLGD